MKERLEEVARRYEQAAAECEVAALHLRTTARHFRDGEVPRGCAHAWAAWGHISGGERLLRETAELHASRSRVEE